VRNLDQAGGNAEQLFVQPRDPLHRGVVAYAFQAVSDCVRGKLTAEIAARLADLVAKLLQSPWLTDFKRQAMIFAEYFADMPDREEVRLSLLNRTFTLRPATPSDD
jgi:hypothetical protein